MSTGNENSSRRWLKAILLLIATALVVGSVDVVVRLQVRGYVESEFAHEKLKKQVRRDVDKMISRGFQEAVDDLGLIGRIFARILVNVEDEKERYLACGRSFVEDEGNRMSVEILSEPVLGMGWCVSCYKLAAKWKGYELATFDVESKRPVNVKVRSCSRFERQLRKECGFDLCG